jgi:outer membrane receptor protein involved in Fe transport
VLRGAEVAGDASGQAVLLNVVRTATAGSGVWEAGFEYTSRDVAAPRGELSYAGRSGNVEYGVGGSIFSQYRDLPGWRRITDGAGVHLFNIDTPSPRDFREATFNGNIAFPFLGGRLAANTQLNGWRFHADSDFLVTDPGGAPIEDLLTVFDEERRGVELGLNYDRDFGPWSLALIALANRARYESEETGENVDHLGANDFSFLQELRQDTGETILRGTLARSLTPRHRIEFGAEAALNSLDQQLQFVLDDGGGPTVITIPNSNVLVEEERAEFFGSHTWRPSEPWSVETRLAWETSTLTFTGDSNQTVELSYWKPSIQLSRTFAGNNQLRFRVYRDVGQLDFGDFTSAAAVADALISGGNPDLEPQTSWIAEIGADLRFPGGAALGLTLSHHQITDVADLVLITVPNPPDPDILFDAPGNIGDAEATRLDVNFSTPLTRFIPGGRLTLQGYLRDTEVTDPVTGRPRIISYTPESEVSISFRQDLPAWRFAWGVEIFKQGEFQAYRFNEVDTSEEGPWIDIFVETTALPNNMKLRAWAANAFDGEIRRDRLFYDPDRTGAFARRDLRERQFASAPWLIVELSGTF